MLNEKDFCDWAEIYLSEAKVIKRIIQKYTEKIKTAKGAERTQIEHDLKILRESYKDCTDRAADLTEKAAQQKVRTYYYEE